MIDVVVAVANQHRPHIPLRIDQLGQPPRNRQRDIFFLGPASAARTGVFAPVPRVDRNNDGLFGHWHHWRRGRFGTRGASRRRDGRRAGIEIDDQAVSVASAGRQYECFDPHGLLQIDHKPQGLRAALAGSHAVDDATAVSPTDGSPRGVGHVDDHSRWIIQREQLVLDGTGQVEHDASGIWAGPDPDILQFHLRKRPRRR